MNYELLICGNIFCFVFITFIIEDKTVKNMYKYIYLLKKIQTV